MAVQYIDAEAFTGLFQQAKRNHNSICEGLYRIAQGCIVKVRQNTQRIDQTMDVEDAAADAVHLAICKIKTFKARALGPNAYSYFTKLIIRQMFLSLRRSRVISRRAVSLPEL